MSVSLPDKLAFVDIETSGGSHLADRIIEIGILRVENGKLVETYQTLIDPQTTLSPFIQQITGIRPFELETAPTFRAVHEKVYQLIQDCVFVAHNVRFDYGFIRQEFNRVKLHYQAKQLCTARLSRHLFPEYRRHNLDSLIERYSFQCTNRHRAFDDAKVLWEFYQKLQHLIPPDHLSQVIKLILQQPSMPKNINSSFVKKLPQKPGVYIFYGNSPAPLYVGKSKNIKKRVLSHFNGDQESGKEMKIAQQLVHIESIVTPGELSALLLESQLVKKHQPLYNRQLRHTRKLMLLKRKLRPDGYYTIEEIEAAQITPDDYPHLISIYKNKQQLKKFLLSIAETHHLCQKLLNLDHHAGPCFASHLGSCYGACIQKEPALKYNLRFLEATSKPLVKNWPFPGPSLVQTSTSL